MNDFTVCPRKISLLKEKIINVGQLLEQCTNYKNSNTELISNNAKLLEKLAAVTHQSLQLLSVNEKASCEVIELRDELSQVKSSLSQAKLEIIQLQQLIDVYKLERDEYGVEKVKALEKKLQMAISEHLYLCQNLKKPGFVFKSMSKEFQNKFVKEIKKSYGKHSTLPSPAWSIESGFESMISSPYSVTEEELQPHRSAALRDEALDKNYEKPLSMLGDDLIRAGCDKVSEKNLSEEMDGEAGCEETRLQDSTFGIESLVEETGSHGSVFRQTFNEELNTVRVVQKSVFEPEDVLPETGNCVAESVQKSVFEPEDVLPETGNCVAESVQKSVFEPEDVLPETGNCVAESVEIPTDIQDLCGVPLTHPRDNWVQNLKLANQENELARCFDLSVSRGTVFEAKDPVANKPLIEDNRKKNILEDWEMVEGCSEAEDCGIEKQTNVGNSSEPEDSRIEKQTNVGNSSEPEDSRIEKHTNLGYSREPEDLIKKQANVGHASQSENSAIQKQKNVEKYREPEGSTIQQQTHLKNSSKPETSKIQKPTNVEHSKTDIVSEKRAVQENNDDISGEIIAQIFTSFKMPAMLSPIHEKKVKKHKSVKEFCKILDAGTQVQRFTADCSAQTEETPRNQVSPTNVQRLTLECSAQTEETPWSQVSPANVQRLTVECSAQTEETPRNQVPRTHVQRFTAECTTQTEEAPRNQVSDSDSTMFKQFLSMFLKVFHKRKRRKPKMGLWVVENVKKKRKLVKRTRKAKRVVDLGSSQECLDGERAHEPIMRSKVVKNNEKSPLLVEEADERVVCEKKEELLVKMCGENSKAQDSCQPFIANFVQSEDDEDEPGKFKVDNLPLVQVFSENSVQEKFSPLIRQSPETLKQPSDKETNEPGKFSLDHEPLFQEFSGNSIQEKSSSWTPKSPETLKQPSDEETNEPGKFSLDHVPLFQEFSGNFVQENFLSCTQKSPETLKQPSDAEKDQLTFPNTTENSTNTLLQKEDEPIQKYRRNSKLPAQPFVSETSRPEEPDTDESLTSNSSDDSEDDPLIKRRLRYSKQSAEVDSMPPLRKSPRLSNKEKSPTEVKNNENVECDQTPIQMRSPSPLFSEQTESTRKSLRLSTKKFKKKSEPVKRALSQLFDSSSDEENDEIAEKSSPKNVSKNRNAEPDILNPLKIPRLELPTETIQNPGTRNDIQITYQTTTCIRTPTVEPRTYSRYQPQEVERPFTRSQKPVPAVRAKNQASTNENWIDYKTKPVRTSLLSAEIIQPTAATPNPPKFQFNFEDSWERSRLMKMKPSVLSQHVGKPVQPVSQLPVVSYPETTRPQLGPLLPVCSIEEPKKSTGNVVVDILTNMEQPPVVAYPVFNVVPDAPVVVKKKKNKKSKKGTQTLDEVLPQPSFKRKEEEIAWNHLETFLKSQNATGEAAAQAVKSCIAALDQVGDNILVKTIVNVVMENVDESPDLRFTPPAPPLTPTQQRLFALMRSYKRLNDLRLDIADEVHSVLLPERFTHYDETVESCGMFIGALYRQSDDATGAVQFGVNVAAGMRQRGCLVLNAVLAAWPEILPLAQNADPWGPGATVATLIMSTPLPTRENQQNSLRKLKTLLNGYYGYEREVNVPDWSRKAIEALRKGEIAAGRALAAVAPICEATSIVAPLLESLGVWEFGGISDCIALKMLDILGTVLKKSTQPNAKQRQFIKQTVPRIGEILLAKRVSFTGQEAVIKLISSLSTKKCRFHDIFEKWKPDQPISCDVKRVMAAAIARSQPKPIIQEKKKKKKKKSKSKQVSC